jgi:hypothetical protein
MADVRVYGWLQRLAEVTAGHRYGAGGDQIGVIVGPRARRRLIALRLFVCAPPVTPALP